MTGERAVQAKVMQSRYRRRCFVCGAAGAETLEHLLLHCSAWEAEREELLAPVIAQLPVLADADLVVVLLGGVAGGEGIDAADYMRGRRKRGVTAVFVQLVKFFAAIQRRQAVRMWAATAQASTSRSQGAVAYG